MVYDYAIVDLQIYLTSTFQAIKYDFTENMDDLPGAIVRTVLLSMINLTDKIKFRKIIFIHDTYPYYKHTILDGAYKEGRTYVTQEMVDSEEDEEIKEELQLEADLFNKRGLAKRILKQMDSVGIPSFYKQGWEADDLAYVFANYVKERDETAVLVSWDSDWNYWINENVDWFSKKRGLISYEETIEQLELRKGLSLFEYKHLYDSMIASHNGTYTSIKEEYESLEMNDILTIYFSNDKDNLFSNKKLFNIQYEALDVPNYPDIEALRSIIENLPTAGHLPSEGEFAEWCMNNGIKLSSSRYMKLIDSLDPKLYWN